MLILLRVLFSTVLVSMLIVTSWAGSQCGLFAIPRDVLGHPWFIATLFDAYWAFVAFFVWAAWKEQRAAAGVLWFIGIILLGNIAIATYMLRELFSIRSSSELSALFARRNAGSLMLAAIVAALGGAIYLAAAVGS